MKKLCSIFVIAAFFILGATADAAKPVDDQGIPFGNGFPSGPHFNLNLLGKKADFNCPPAKYDEFGQQIFGNVIFIPRDQAADPITILMESGTKGPKGAPDTLSLEVTDWCSESFPDSGMNQGDAAMMRLPKNDNGYAVYARITGKPGKNGEPSVSLVPDLYYVEDESGNDLLLLGLVDRDGTATFTSSGMTINRTSTDGKGKGVLKATNISDLFSWSGEVCYIETDFNLYCVDENNDYICSTYSLCCVDSNGDFLFDRCDSLNDVGVIAEDGVTLVCPATDVDGNAYESVDAQCRSFENEWVFNISDFVGYLWELDSTGAYNIQVRFYPL